MYQVYFGKNLWAGPDLWMKKQLASSKQVSFLQFLITYYKNTGKHKQLASMINSGIRRKKKMIQKYTIFQVRWQGSKWVGNDKTSQNIVIFSEWEVLGTFIYSFNFMCMNVSLNVYALKHICVCGGVCTLHT